MCAIDLDYTFGEQGNPFYPYHSHLNRYKLALDVISFEENVATAMQYACGNTLICDTLEDARNLAYRKKKQQFSRIKNIPKVRTCARANRCACRGVMVLIERLHKHISSVFFFSIHVLLSCSCIL